MVCRQNADFLSDLEAELKRWPGTGFEYVRAGGGGGHHPRIYLIYDENRRFITISGSPGDWRANKKRMRDVRNTLTLIGAKRSDAK